MAEHDLIAFFLQVGVMLAVALLAGEAARRLGQPAVLGEIIGGIILGPSILGLLAPGIHSLLFVQGENTHRMLNAFVNLGMLYFLFIAGMEVDLSKVRSRGRASLLMSVFGIVVPFALGSASVLLFPAIWDAPSQSGSLFPIFVGAALSISALPVIIRILMDLDLIRTELGQSVVTSAIIDDLAGWSLFVYILGVMTSAGAANPLMVLLRVVLMGASFLLLGRFLGDRFLRFARRAGGEAGGLLAMISVAVLAGAVAASRCGVHPVFGAFLVGVALGPTLRHTPCVDTIIRQFAISLFAPLYFVSIGLRLDFTRFFDLPLVLLVVAVAFTGKLAGVGAGALLGRMKPRDAVAAAFALNARGAVEIILAGVALSAGVIDNRIFLSLVVMAFVTTMVSVPVIRHFSRPGAVRGEG